MSSLSSVTNETLEAVLQDFHVEAEMTNGIGVDTEEYIRNVLNKALGIDKASNLLNRIMITKDASGIESLKWMDSKSVADLIRFEHPQIIATIIVHLEPYQASQVLSFLSERTRMEVILRTATLDGVQPAAINELNDVLTNLLLSNESIRKKPIGGVRATSAIINFMSGELESATIARLREIDPDLAQSLLDNMFIFDNLADIEDRDIQTILREVPSASLIVAIKGAKEEVKEKFFKNMSLRAAEMMREDIDAKGPVRLSEIEKQQKEILQLVRRLADEGQISTTKGDASDFV